MSYWTSITAVMLVETLIEDKNIAEIVKSTINKEAPKITGSERNADIFVNVESGHNTYTNRDCKHCQFESTIKKFDYGRFTCEQPENFECPEGKYQTVVVITISGGLRDRFYEDTQKEYQSFKKFIQKKYLMLQSSCQIRGEKRSEFFE